MQKIVYCSLIVLLISMNFTICRASEYDLEKETKDAVVDLFEPIILADADIGELQEMVEIGGGGEIDYVDYYELGRDTADENYRSILPFVLGFFSFPTLLFPLSTIAVFSVVVFWKVSVPQEYIQYMSDEDAIEFSRGYASRARMKKAGGYAIGLAAGAVALVFILKAFFEEIEHAGD